MVSEGDVAAAIREAPPVIAHMQAHSALQGVRVPDEINMQKDSNKKKRAGNLARFYGTTSQGYFAITVRMGWDASGPVTLNS